MTAAVILGSLFLVAGWEYWLPRRQRRFPALRRRVGNIGFWVLNLLLAAFLLGAPDRVRPLLEIALGTKFLDWPIVNARLSVVAGFLLLDLARYAVHRCLHAVPMLWRLHALHHSDPDVDVTSSLRHHPIEYVLTSLVYWCAVIGLGIPSVVVLGYGLAVFALEALQHGNIGLPERVESWLQLAIVTPDMHRIHHSAALDEANANYGAVLSCWDRLFGSYMRLNPAQHAAIVFGVRELPPRDCLKPSMMILTPWLLSRAKQAGRRSTSSATRANRPASAEKLARRSKAGP